MDLHPYDGKERRFRYDDATRDDGRMLVANFLRLPSAPRDAVFDMRFYSGGMGIVDHVAIAFAAERDEAARIAESLGFVGADEIDVSLLDGDGDLAQFIAEHRRGFQPDYADGDPIWFEDGSDDIHWSVLWHAHGMLAYAAYDQG